MSASHDRPTYRDRWIECTPDEVRVRGYYFRWGTKRIAYSSIRSVTHVTLGALTGKARVWGTTNPRYWASLDPGRPRKKDGLILDLGTFIRPFITPDDADAVEAVIRDRSALRPASRDVRRGPVI
jgi:hypothetical protein